MNRAQEIALLMESYRQDSIQLVAAVFSRTEYIRQHDSFRFGHGNSVYFFKILYNCFRSSRLLTRTGVTYLIAALYEGFFDRRFLDRPVIYIPVLLLAAMVFFRSILSPVTEDIHKASFLMQPGSVWAKLFFSVLGGGCVCALDVLLPLMAGSWASGFSPLKGILFLPALVSVDFFASTAGAFVDVSLPQSIGTTFKQVIQILLLYVGLIFDGMILTSGITGGFLGVGFALVTAVNIIFGAFFLGLTGVWLYPCSGRPVRTEPDKDKAAEAKKVYTTVGLALTGMYLATYICQGLFTGLPSIIALYLPIYAIGFPVFLMILRPRKQVNVAAFTLRPAQFLLLIPVCFFVMYSGSIIGNLLSVALHRINLLPFPTPVGTMEHPGLQVLFLVIVSPLMEEFVFRRCVTEKVLPYGTRTAVIASALLFGLFHRSINQFCYAFMLGLVFGWVYVRTRRLRYSALLHVLINALGTLVLPTLMSQVSGSVSFQAMSRIPIAKALVEPGVLPLILYVAFLFVSSLFGAVVFAFGLRERALPRDGVSVKEAFSPWSMILFTVISCIGIYAAL